MPPKIKIQKQDIINIGLNLVREHGEAAINARSIATALQCSTQPIFSNFSSMEELKFELIDAAEKLCLDYINKEIEQGLYPPFKASGMAYIRFAKEEKELFKLLYMRDRTNDHIPTGEVLWSHTENMIHHNTGLGGSASEVFHLEIWAFVHGIATMMATNFLDLDWELVSQMLTDSYLGLKKQYEKE